MPEDTRTTYLKLFNFFLPLAITPILIGSTHTIISAALARLAYPELNLAVFTVVKSISNIIRAPILTTRQTILSLTDNRTSFHTTRRVVWWLTGSVLFVLFLLGYSPLGAWVLKNIIGLNNGQQIEFAYFAFRITMWLPVVEVLRNNQQGLAVGLEQTKIMIPGIVLRLIVISGFLWWVVANQVLLGVIAGSLAWVVGIGIEALFMIFGIRYLYRSPARAADKMRVTNSEEVRSKAVLKFLIPLGIMMMLKKFLQPLIQSGIARGVNPTESLAAFGVAWTLVFLVSGPLRMLHQCSMVYVDRVGSEDWKKTLNFSIMVGLSISGVLVLIALSPFGYWVLNSVIAVSPAVTGLARRTILAFSVFPLIWSFRETFWGILMQERTTGIIGTAKAINIVTVIGFLSVGMSFLELEAAVLGGIAYTVGEAVESLVIWRHVSRREIRIKAES